MNIFIKRALSGIASTHEHHVGISGERLALKEGLKNRQIKNYLEKKERKKEKKAKHGTN